MSASGSFGVNYTRVFTTDDVPTLPAKLGDIGSSPEGDFMFVKAGEALTQYDWVSVQSDYTVLQLETANASVAQQCGAAQVAASTGQYLWIFIGGPGGGGTGVGIKARFINYTANGIVYTTTTPGVCDDVLTTRILNVKGLTTVGGTAAAAEIWTSGYITSN